MEAKVFDSDIVQLVTCDWLQFWCLAPSWQPTSWEANSPYKFKQNNMGTRVFSQVWQIYEKAAVTRSHRDEPFAVVARKPYSSILDRTMILVKVDNKQLYRADLYTKLVRLLSVCEWRYKAITRLDICCDLNEFADQLQPNALISRYNAGVYLKAGTNRTALWYERKLSISELEKRVRKTLHPRDEMAYHIATDGRLVPHQLTFGAPQADVHAKLYNKTKEIAEESHKTYISRYWRDNGLDTERDVWRVEISISRRARCLAKEQDGELIKVGLLEACNPTWQKATFLGLAARHFHFKQLPPKEHQRKLQDVSLWSIFSDIQLLPATTIEKESAGRTAKVCANYLLKLRDSTDLQWLKIYERYPTEVIERMRHLLSCIYSDLSFTTERKKEAQLQELTTQVNQLRFEQMFGISHGVLDYMRDEDLMQELDAKIRNDALNEELQNAMRQAEAETEQQAEFEEYLRDYYGQMGLYYT